MMAYLTLGVAVTVLALALLATTERFASDMRMIPLCLLVVLVPVLGALVVFIILRSGNKRHEQRLEHVLEHNKVLRERLAILREVYAEDDDDGHSSERGKESAQGV